MRPLLASGSISREGGQLAIAKTAGFPNLPAVVKIQFVGALVRMRSSSNPNPNPNPIQSNSSFSSRYRKFHLQILHRTR